MKERFGRVGARGTGNKLPKFAGRARFALAMIALVILCVSAVAQENTAEVWYKKGLELEKNGSPDEAILAYDKAIDLNPTKAVSAYVSKGHLLMQLKKYNESLETFDKAIEHVLLNDSQNLSQVWEFKAIILEEIGRPEEAYHAFDTVTELDSNRTLAWIEKGNLLNKMGRYEEASTAYETVLQLKPLSATELINAWMGKGNALDKMGQYEEALGTYTKALEIINHELEKNPESYLAWRDKGMILYKMDKYEEAIKAYDKAQKTSTYSFVSGQIWWGKGDAFKALNHNAEAQEAYAKARELGYNQDF